MKMKHVRPGLEKKGLIVRLRRIKGQVEGLERMIESDADCSDVLMQVVSARQALKSFCQEVIEALFATLSKLLLWNCRVQAPF